MNVNFYNVYSVIRIQLCTWTTNLQSTVTDSCFPAMQFTVTFFPLPVYRFVTPNQTTVHHWTIYLSCITATLSLGVTSISHLISHTRSPHAMFIPGQVQTNFFVYLCITSSVLINCPLPNCYSIFFLHSVIFIIT